MSSEDIQILEFNHADLEYLIKKVDGCKNKPENSSTTNLGEHNPSGFSMSTIRFFKNLENKYDICRGKDCGKKFCESLREHGIKISNFQKKKNKVINKRAAGII